MTHFAPIIDRANYKGPVVIVFYVCRAYISSRKDCQQDQGEKCPADAANNPPLEISNRSQALALHHHTTLLYHQWAKILPPYCVVALVRSRQLDHQVTVTALQGHIVESTRFPTHVPTPESRGPSFKSRQRQGDPFVARETYTLIVAQNHRVRAPAPNSHNLSNPLEHIDSQLHGNGSIVPSTADTSTLFSITPPSQLLRSPSVQKTAKLRRARMHMHSHP